MQNRFEEKVFGDTAYTHKILQLDQAYARSLCLNYWGTEYIERVQWVMGTPYVNYQFKCDLCGNGNHKKHNRPASFFPTTSGYLYTCAVCRPGLTLYQFLRGKNPFIADQYVVERWVNKLSGQGFNCPHPPKKLRAEYYKRIAEEERQKNKDKYERGDDRI